MMGGRLFFSRIDCERRIEGSEGRASPAAA